mmetsp:Transcript_66895/g.169703  ORF Transcript_66895/g.169703 Transcript_66895/m.169703 type:complete len:176 (+) Transcript_66895:79-606(+)
MNADPDQVIRRKLERLDHLPRCLEGTSSRIKLWTRGPPLFMRAFRTITKGTSMAGPKDWLEIKNSNAVPEMWNAFAMGNLPRHRTKGLKSWLEAAIANQIAKFIMHTPAGEKPKSCLKNNVQYLKVMPLPIAVMILDSSHIPATIQCHRGVSTAANDDEEKEDDGDGDAADVGSS